MGISYEEFKHMNPRKLEYVRDGYKQKIKQIDALNWMNGQYTMSAVAVAIEANFANNPKGKYMKKPVIFAMETREEDLQKQREAFLAGLLAMQANYELEHPKVEKNTDGTT